jgi:hypothetical protein
VIIDSDASYGQKNKIEEAKLLSKQIESITRDFSSLKAEISGAKFDSSSLDEKAKK